MSDTTKSITISHLRSYTERHLRALIDEQIITYHTRPLAVLMPYDLYFKLRQELEAWIAATDRVPGLAIDVPAQDPS